MKKKIIGILAAAGLVLGLGLVVCSRMLPGEYVPAADEIALTKLDVLSEFDEIDVCTAYELDGKVITEFPFSSDLARCKPIYTTLKGWKKDISSCRKAEELPEEALAYIRFIEKATESYIRYVSVGASREAYIVLEK